MLNLRVNKNLGKVCSFCSEVTLSPSGFSYITFEPKKADLFGYLFSHVCKIAKKKKAKTVFVFTVI